jgi:chromosome partitioning protein
MNFDLTTKNNPELLAKI